MNEDQEITNQTPITDLMLDVINKQIEALSIYVNRVEDVNKRLGLAILNPTVSKEDIAKSSPVKDGTLIIIQGRLKKMSQLLDDLESATSILNQL